MDPELVRQWQRIFRDSAAVVVGIFLLVYGAIMIHDPTVLGIVLAAGITCIGAPPIVRGITAERNGNGNGNGKKP